jgi:hypothetical protein
LTPWGAGTVCLVCIWIGQSVLFQFDSVCV